MRSKMKILLTIKKYKQDQGAIENKMKEKGHFYAWQCFSLITDTRTVDFIVPDRSDLLYLVHGLKTALYSLNSEAGD